MAQHTNVDENGIVRIDNCILPCPVCNTPNQFYDIGSFDICSVCGWEDDEIQYDEPDLDDVSNPMSLNKAKKM